VGVSQSGAGGGGFYFLNWRLVFCSRCNIIKYRKFLCSTVERGQVLYEDKGDHTVAAFTIVFVNYYFTGNEEAIIKICRNIFPDKVAQLHKTSV